LAGLSHHVRVAIAPSRARGGTRHCSTPQTARSLSLNPRKTTPIPPPLRRPSCGAWRAPGRVPAGAQVAKLGALRTLERIESSVAVAAVDAGWVASGPAESGKLDAGDAPRLREQWWQALHG